jgi:hypothetical protein
MAEPRLFRVAAADGARIFAVYGVAFEGKLWIVPEWHEPPGEDWRTPERMICFDDLPHQSFPPNNPIGVDFAINTAIPKEILDGSDPAPHASGYVVIHRPPLRFAREEGAQNAPEPEP